MGAHSYSWPQTSSFGTQLLSLPHVGQINVYFVCSRIASYSFNSVSPDVVLGGKIPPDSLSP